MSAAFQGILEAASRVGEPAVVWRSFCQALPAGVEPNDVDLAAALRLSGLRVRPAEWRACLVGVGVLSKLGTVNPEGVETVANCLRLVGGDSPPADSWHLVATFPPAKMSAQEGVVPQTAGVLLGLIDRARVKVHIASPFADYAGAGLLADAVLDCAKRSVDVVITTSAGSGYAFDGFASEWSKVKKPGAVFRCLESVATDGSVLGSHAKVVVVDDIRGYIGSANLTGAGLARQFELGVEVEGREVARLAELIGGLEQRAVLRVEAVSGPLLTPPS